MNLRKIFEKAQAEKFALGAFNVSTLEHVKAVLAAAKKKNAPVMLELSPGEASFFGVELLGVIRDSFSKVEDQPQIYLNLDHARDVSSVERALEVGFDMVHFDGSDLPFQENIRITKAVVEKAHEIGTLVEGEFDKAGGHSTVKVTKGSVVLTDPQRAAEFVSKTGVDLLACFFGNLHGVYSRELELNFSHFKKVEEAVCGACSGLDHEVFFSLHGGSGVKALDLSNAAKKIIVKMNFNTELRQAWASSLRESLNAEPEQIVPYKLLPPVVDAVGSIIESKIDLLRCS